MKRLALARAFVCLAAVAFASAAAAQGLQTGTLSGSVKDQQDLVLPGVTVTATSPAMQGARTTVTDGHGLYTMPGLPPGVYTVDFELQGMTTVRGDATVVPLGGVAEVNATLRLAGAQENVQVIAEAAPPALATTQNSTNFKAELINTLPIGRRPFEIAELAPGVTDNTPNVGQMAIGGALAFDTIFLIDGVDTNDNLFGTSTNLFIEDAIQETQVLTSGISAEYGRFSGGVVNVITRSGGNGFHGSFRANLARPSWTNETPFETERSQTRSEVLSKFYEGTIGGPIVRNRLWFFNADRYENSQQGLVFAEIGGAYARGTNNKRFELKLTGTPIANHTVSGNYVNNPAKATNRPTINDVMSMTASTLSDREDVNNLWVVNWNGVVTSRVFGTFQWSRKDQSIQNAGGTSTAITDSPILTRGTTGIPANRHFNAPYFSAIDPEDRNNRQFAGSVSYFASDPTFGRHDVKAGMEHFKSFRTGGGSQSATGFVIQTDYALAGGRPLLDAEGEPVPIWGGNAANPSAAGTRIVNWISEPGATLDIKTLSFYLQDRWTAAHRVTVDLGVRYEKVRTEATGDIIGADTDTFLPRLGVSIDLDGSGQTIGQATYGRYSGRFTERAFGRNTNVATPSSITYGYVGPSGTGMSMTEPFSLTNYAVIGGNVPTANVFFDDNLTSPKTNEFTLSLGREFGRGGYAKATYVWRNTTDFIEDFINDPSPAGKVTVAPPGVTPFLVDRVLFANSDLPQREYQAVQLESRVTFTRRLFVEGHWTVQVRNHGSFEGEAANQPGNPSLWLDYPELYDEARHVPFGRLDEFQRHKLRFWTSYTQGLGPVGNISIAPIWRINSGQTYSLFATGVAHTAAQLARNPGYLRTAGTSASLFFDERGSEDFKGYALLDLSLRYGVPVWKSAEPWIQLHMYNVLNNQKLIQWSTSVTPDPNSPLDALGLRTGYVPGATFGQATAASHYPRWSSGETGGRTFRVAMGIRF